MASSTAARLRTGVDKFEDRRRELADATLLTLADLGYARTSLRTIAEQTDFSHGLLHYYFADKTELITYCVRRYKTACVQRYEGLVAESSTPDELAEACGNALAATLADASPTAEGSLDLVYQPDKSDAKKKMSNRLLISPMRAGQ